MDVPSTPAEIIESLEKIRDCASANQEIAEQSREDMRAERDAKVSDYDIAIHAEDDAIEAHRQAFRTAVQCLQFLAGERQDYRIEA